MSSNPSFSAPVLNYVGSVDVASATTGTTLYNILFDSSLCTIGNVLMFEYKIQPTDVIVPEPDTITLGYVNIENAIFNSGISNQWTIAIPASNNIYDPPIPQQISVRVYSGLTGSTEIAVSPWSNSLDAHVPPTQPVIYSAFFDQNNGTLDDLWIYMTPTDEYDYTEIKFIVASYFQDASAGTTIWSVSDPLDASSVVIGNNTYKVLHVPEIGNVSAYDPVVYTAVYAVYPFTYNTEQYYSVSEISTTYTAIPAFENTAPTITSINYEVYDSAPAVPGDQTMVVNWTAPPSSGVPGYFVTNYVLQLSTNNGTTWSDVSRNIPPQTLSYAVDVSDYGAGTNISFRVYAILSDVLESLPSNVESLYVFQYSLAPQNLTLVSAAPSGNLADIVISFQNPSDIGFGAGYQYVIKFSNTLGEDQDIKYEPYNASTGTYTLTYNGLNISPNGTISVYLETEDTNQPGGSTIYRNSASTSTSYIVSSTILQPVDYLVYTNGTQDMVLTWSNPTTDLTGWSVSSYEVYLNDGAYDLLITTITDGATTYTYDAASQPCGETLTFYVVANVVNNSTSFTIESNSESINIFRYADAPQNLYVVGVAPSGNLANIELSFQNPSNIGCGDGYQYVIEFSNTSGEVQETKYEPYNASTGSYTLMYNGLNISPNGTISVYLQTEDTNQPDVFRDGASTSTPYIVSSVTLDPVDYKVYTNRSQDMVLTWSNPTTDLTGWSVSSYDVYLAAQGIIATITNGDTTYTYDAASQPCGVPLAFYVKANVVNNSTNFAIYSNSESINIFRYADAPQGVIVDWAASDTNNTIVDILTTFIVPSNYSSGCGSVIQWVIQVYDSTNQIISSVTQNTPYVLNQTFYSIYFNNVPYTPSGSVRVFLTTNDTNGQGVMDGAYASGEFISGGLPIFENVIINNSRTLLTFDVLSQTQLARVGRFAWVTLSGGDVNRLGLPFITGTFGSNIGIDIQVTILPNNVIKYSYEVSPTFFSSPTLPNNLSIAVSNQVGISIENTNNN